MTDSAAAGKHVVHISTVHSSMDPRIRLKELRSAAKNGFRTILVTADPAARELGDGVRIERVPASGSGRPGRVLVTAPRAVLRAFGMRADLYHVHDPELIPWAWLLLLKRVPVVYDIHEDYVTSLLQKSYLPVPLRKFAASLVSVLERLATGPFYRIIAERYYERRFPDAFPVLNYPSGELLSEQPAFSENSEKVIYTGTVSEDRGALNLAALAAKRPGLEVLVIGRCPVALSGRMKEAAGRGARLMLDGEGRYVPFREIMGHYRRGGLLAGVALFPDTLHYREKELTKFFEYMAAGLPIVASDFPVWKRLIEDNGVGLCVGAGDIDAVSGAIDRLRERPDEAAAMSERGRRLVADRFNWEREGQRLVGYYRKITGE